MKKYLEYFKTNFREEATYKADFFFYIGSEIVFFVVFFFIWTNVYAKGGTNEIASFSLSATITYYFLTSILFRLNPAQGIYLNREIWNGVLTSELPRPYSIKFLYLVSSLSIMSIEMIAYLPFAIIIFFFVSQYIIFISLANLILFILAMLFSCFLGMGLYLFLHSLCFHFGDQEANIGLATYMIAFLGGALFPLKFLPSGLYTAFSYMPFKFLFDFPASIYLGKLTQTEVAYGFVQMLLWTIFFFCLYYFSFKLGIKKYTAIGR